MNGYLQRGGERLCDVSEIRLVKGEPNPLATCTDAAALDAGGLLGVTFVVERYVPCVHWTVDLIVGGWSIPIRITQLRFRRAVASVRWPARPQTLAPVVRLRMRSR